MSATVIDSLLVTLGIDPRQFIKGANEANKAQDNIGKQSARTTRETSDRERKLATERRSRSLEVEGQAKAMAASLRGVRNELLGLLGLFLAGSGLKTFVGNTIESAAQLGLLSKNLKMSTEDVQAWQRANERAGGSKEGIVSQLKESSAAIAALKIGLGPNEGMQWFFRMGGSSKDLKDGNSYLLARSKIVHDLFEVDPTKAALVAAQMGISDEQFNLIKQGPAAIMALVDAQRKNSAITEKDAAGALVLRNRWLDFKASLEATSTKILVAMIPALEQFVGWLESSTKWITDNKDAIGQWVTDLVSKALPVLTEIGRTIASTDWKAVSNGAKEFGVSINDLAKSLRELLDLWHEWNGTKDKSAFVAKKAGDGIVSMVADEATEREAGKKPKDKRGDLEKAGDQIYSAGVEIVMRTMASFGNQAAKEWIRDMTGKDDYLAGPKVNKKASADAISQLVKMGWSDEQAAGLVANFSHESGMNPAAVGDNGKAYGIGQWHPDRQADFKKRFGKDIRGSSLADQLAFVDFELREGKEQAAGNKLFDTTTAAQAAAVVARDYERPANAASEAAKRAATATALDSARRASNAAAAAKTPTGPALTPVSRGGPQASTVTTDVRIGSMVIQTRATDAEGIARDLPSLLEKNGAGFAAQANTGVA